MPSAMSSAFQWVPPEGAQTCLAFTFALAFVLGVASVGAVYRAVLQHVHPERAHDLTTDALRTSVRAGELRTPPILTLALVRLLLRLAFDRRSGA